MISDRSQTLKFRPVLALWVPGLMITTALILTGCSVTELPTYDAVRYETGAAMQRIVDELPPGSRVEPNPNDTPFGCGDEGIFYTGQWAVYPETGFNADAFVEQLPTALGDDFKVDDLGIDVSYPSLDLIATAYGNVGISISVIDNEGIETVGITATSRCARPPARILQ